MKLIFIVLTLIFIGCGNPETPEIPDTQEPPAVAGDLEQQGVEPVPFAQAVEAELETGVASQTVLTCRKEGTEDIVYFAKTYDTPTPCQHAKATGKLCLCEVVSENSFFNNRNGVYLYATSTADWCEKDALNGIEQDLGVTVYGATGTETEFVNAAHDASYTCSRS